MAILKSRALKRLAETLFVLGCIVAIYLMIIDPIFTSHPSQSAVRHWEKHYSSVLPPGYSDFRGHWQSQDIGVHIFSFRPPEGLDCEAVLDGLEVRLGGYRVDQRVPGELSLRRGATHFYQNGFDEFRFVCVPSAHRVYAMFANLDTEMDVHPELVKQLHEIASGRPE